jgi:hypothetical protein
MELKLIQEDEKLLTRRIEVRVNGKRFETPIKSFELISSKESSPLNLLGDFTKEVSGFIEFRLNISQQQLKRIDKDEEQTSRFISKISQQLKNVGNNVVLLIPIYKVEDLKISVEEIECLSSILLSLVRRGIVDVFSLPLLKLIKQNLKSIPLDLYFKNFTRPFLEYLFSYNNEKIARCLFGYIPKVSHRQVSEIINFYIKYSVTNFIVEFNSSTPINYAPVLEKLIRSVLLMEKEIGREGTLLHGINVNRGLGRKEIEKIGAKDILAFYQGITSFSFPFKPVLKQLEEPIFRSFEQEDYGYYKISNDKLELLAEKEKIIKGKNLKDVEKAINTKLIYRESLTIKEKLKENELFNHLNSKKEVQTYLRRLQKFSNKLREEDRVFRLDKFL